LTQNMTELCNKHDETPLHLAARSKREDIVEILQQHQAKLQALRQRDLQRKEKERQQMFSQRERSAGNLRNPAQLSSYGRARSASFVGGSNFEINNDILESMQKLGYEPSFVRESL